MSISEKANDLLNKFGRAQSDFMVWDTPDNLVARDKARQEISDYIEELEAENDQLTAHSDIERQDDKSSNDTQTQTFVYGKDSKPIPCPFCGEIVKECNDVATAAGGEGMTLLDIALIVVALAGLVQFARCMRGER